MDKEYNPRKVEERLQKSWREKSIYHYQKPGDDKDVFSIDTPPPTVSGNLHFGHTYGNTLADFKARYERMQKDQEVYFPFGYDNNGIASERLTERELEIEHGDHTREEFQEKVRKVCKKYEKDFEEIMREFAFSFDWNNVYKTIEPRVQEISQKSFLELQSKGRQYREKGPVIWCPECETAISQVEMEDSDPEKSHFNNIEFPLASGNGSVIISTTRPELLPACVAIFVHPDDESNGHLVGENANVPLFDYEVPILEDERVDRETGTGVVMCCTFGDQTDIEWYQAHDLDLRIAIDESGTLTEKAGKYEGMSTGEAREEIVDDLEKQGKLLDRWQIEHTKKVHERCDTPIEFLVKEQWYIKLLDKKDEYLEAGQEMDWYPEKMYKRYKNWIEGLEWDWCISRQRDSGIPIPAWYHKETGEPVFAEPEQLPVDPKEDQPPVDNPEDYEPETDVLDTWATSSLTPLINADWDGEQCNRPELYPIDMRYQGHDIISFWLFHTVVKCYEHTGKPPFEEVLIHGWVLDENREKMSKSRGNVTTPQEVLEDYPVDAARYWGGAVSPGDDLPLKEKDLVEGEKFLRKLWNASRLIEQQTQLDQVDVDHEELDKIDQWMLAETNQLIEKITRRFENYQFEKARDELRHHFWDTFCDNYLEIAKQKIKNEEKTRGTEYTLREAHKAYLKMFAPITPHITDKIWKELYSERSIHQKNWPSHKETGSEVEKGRKALEVISTLRKYKTQNQMPLNEKLETVRVKGDIKGFEKAIKQVMHVQEIEILEEEPEMEEEIIEITLNYEKAGPKYGDDVGEIEEALENGNFSIDTGKLRVAGKVIKPELFNVKRERRYKGQGEMMEEEDIVVIIKR